MNAAVETTRLGKRYGSVWGLRGCSLRVETGSVVALVGPNGAGKSTLLNLLTGLVDPTEGQLLIDGSTVTEAIRSAVSYTAQGHPLYRSFSVVDMVTAGRRLNTRWDDSGVRARLASLDIGLNRKVATLSGGQQAQVSLALALAKQPRLLLLDEPLAALDPIARREFMQVLMAAAADGDLTVVLSSHVVAELERVCDHLIALNHGQVQLAGSIDDLLADHRVVTGPAEAAGALRRTQIVVASSDVGRQTTAVIRHGRQPLDPVWHAETLGLEELVLTYLSHPQAGALPGPTALIPEAIA